ncbi:hypothetical protein LTR37_012469 [Vermiconidia calcicola]|uniref:Uncharacterized protein n=1 Tax=Vermiconidia calcicola TaxID=1690605 RepID=A0ACC3MZ98_9PEZI|nr:hypothetical protein LTR37_012469 [Vermiconidia calcicola]
MAGKDPRLAEPVKVKKVAINNQDFCQQCYDGGEVVLCCLEKPFQHKTKANMFYCPQHECVDCQAKTADAGGLIYRCRWCENGYCEDCLDWDTARLIEETLPEFEMLGYAARENAWYIECSACVKHWETDQKDLVRIGKERKRIQKEYEAFVAATAAMESESVVDTTPATVSEVTTPVPVFSSRTASSKKKKKTKLL